MARTLYSGTRNASSWAFRAWLALKEADIPFVEVVVDIRRPQRFANLARIAEFSPPAAVPVLVDGGTVIYDSLAIMEYANDLSGGRLLRTVLRLASHMPSLEPWSRCSSWMKLLPGRTAVQEWLAEARSLPPVHLADGA